MRGDALASGKVHSAQFNTEGNDTQFVADLKILPSSQVEDKYGISQGKYTEYVTALRDGGALPLLQPRAEQIPSPNPEIPEEAQQTEVPINYRGRVCRVGLIEDVPKIRYRGNPIGDNVLLLPTEKENSSRIVIPDANKAKTNIAFVSAVGEKVKKVKVGQLVVFNRFASDGMEIELTDAEGVDRTYILCKDYDILLPIERVDAV